MLGESTWNGSKKDYPLHHFQKTLEPHLYLSFPSHSKAKSSEINGTFCINPKPIKNNQLEKNYCRIKPRNQRKNKREK
jgi:hypothetical protein